MLKHATVVGAILEKVSAVLFRRKSHADAARRVADYGIPNQPIEAQAFHVQHSIRCQDRVPLAAVADIVHQPAIGGAFHAYPLGLDLIQSNRPVRHIALDLSEAVTP